jgi:hypothetical protein
MSLRKLVIVFSFALVPSAFAQDTYLEPESFLKETFPVGVPQPRLLWIIGDIQKKVITILGHEWAQLRVRYWYKGERSAWILEEIGKEEPITAGIVIDQGKIERVEVLIFRESRGWEVRHDFFTEQFEGAKLRKDGELNRAIDNITGATLSVRALTKLARLALYFHKQVAS